jgi:glycosyltransferase involved in cell wall biosynthesis
MRKKVLIISEFHLHQGGSAAYERMKCYAKAIPDLDFICFHFDLNFRKPIKLTRHKGSENLFFVSEVTKRNSFLNRNLLSYFDFYRPLQLCKFVLGNYQSDKVKVLLMSSHFLLFSLVIFYIKYLNKYSVIVEKSELETGIISNIFFQPVGLNILFYLLLPYRFILAFLIDRLTKKASGVIAISTRIQKKYYDFVSCTLIPILVDIDRFKHKLINSADQKVRFVYLGAITKKKDEIEELIRSFNNLGSKYNNFQVDLFGSGSRHYLKKINQYIAANKLSGVINIKDPVESSQVPDLLIQYDYGLLLRSRNSQTQYGFSTKLGEYLAAGLPVIFSDVSDNLLYLEDEVHGFLAPFPFKDNLERTLEKAILTPPEERKKMSENAIKMARSSFDYRVHADKLKKIFA